MLADGASPPGVGDGAGSALPGAGDGGGRDPVDEPAWTADDGVPCCFEVAVVGCEPGFDVVEAPEGGDAVGLG